MSAVRLTIFVIALLLAVSAIQPTGPWLVALAVLAGLWPWGPIRLTVFIISLLLAAGAMEATEPWLVTLAVLAGLALFWERRGRKFGLPGLPSPRDWYGRRWSEEFDW